MNTSYTYGLCSVFDMQKILSYLEGKKPLVSADKARNRMLRFQSIENPNSKGLTVLGEDVFNDFLSCEQHAKVIKNKRNNISDFEDLREKSEEYFDRYLAPNMFE